MNISGVKLNSANVVAFKGKEKKESHKGAAVASFIMPGTGQLIKGEKKKAAKHFGIYAGLSALSTAVFAKLQLPKIIKNAENFAKATVGSAQTTKFITVKDMYKGIPKAAIAASVVLALATFALSIFSAKDAAKPKKAE